MISKERLWEIHRRINVPGVINLTGFQCGQIAQIESLIEECGDSDTLVVSKLRPMCDVRGIYGYVIVYPTTHGIAPGEGIEACLIGGGLMQTRDGHNYRFAELEGWVAKPIYKP